MKSRLTLRELFWLLAITSVSVLWLSACCSPEEHPSAEHPTKEHPEHPTTPAPKNP